jgi:hypothetical protein
MIHRFALLLAILCPTVFAAQPNILHIVADEMGWMNPLPPRADGDAVAAGFDKRFPLSKSMFWCQAILARMINDAERSSCDHHEPLNIAVSRPPK